MPVDPAPPRFISTKVYNRDRRDKGSSRCSDWSGGNPYSGDSSPPRERHSLADFPSPTQDLRHDGRSTGRRSRPIPAANTGQVCCVAGRGEADELSMLVEEAGLCAVSSAPCSTGDSRCHILRPSWRASQNGRRPLSARCTHQTNGRRFRYSLDSPKPRFPNRTHPLHNASCTRAVRSHHPGRKPRAKAQGLALQRPHRRLTDRG
jgi:hypothetical protein